MHSHILEKIPETQGTMWKKMVSSVKDGFYNLVNKKESRMNVRNSNIKSFLNFRNNIKEFNILPNLIKNSYVNRFLLKKYLKLYKKTVGLRHARSLSTTEEFQLLKEKEHAILKEEKYHALKKRFKYSFKDRLSNRAPKAGKVYIRHTRANSFLTIFKIFGEDYENDKQVVLKVSCGTIGYHGPKKATRYASEQVFKAGGKFINQQRFTSLDINFIKKTAWWNKRALRGLLTDPIYLRNFSIDHIKAHGFRKFVNERRV